jgi:hypothetical protein
LSSLEAPVGTDMCGTLGTSSSSACSRSWMVASMPSNDFSCSGIAPTSAITALASSPLLLSAPICRDSALRRACMSSVRVCTALRSVSSASKATRSKLKPRAASRAAVPAASLRRRVMSSICFSSRSRRTGHFMSGNVPRVAAKRTGSYARERELPVEKRRLCRNGGRAHCMGRSVPRGPEPCKPR